VYQTTRVRAILGHPESSSHRTHLARAKDCTQEKLWKKPDFPAVAVESASSGPFEVAKKLLKSFHVMDLFGLAADWFNSS
jgi:hypothetical protein